MGAISYFNVIKELSNERGKKKNSRKSQDFFVGL